MQYREDPAYEIHTIGLITDYNRDIPEYYAELWVYNSTPENKKLDNALIEGWKIQVYSMAKSIQMQEKMAKLADTK